MRTEILRGIRDFLKRLGTGGGGASGVPKTPPLGNEPPRGGTPRRRFQDWVEGPVEQLVSDREFTRSRRVVRRRRRGETREPGFL